MMIHLGIDVAKAEVVVWDGETIRAVRNEESALRAFLAGFAQEGTLAMESTGGFEGELARLAYEAGWRVYVLQPSWVKAHARVLGGRSKTDAIDARVIRSYLLAYQEELRPWKPKEESMAALRALLRQRQALAENIVKLRASLKALCMTKHRLDEALEGLLKVRNQIDRDLKALLAKEPKAKRLLAVPGVGIQTAAAVLTTLQGGEFLRAEAFVAFAGLDPVAKDSGKSSGQRRISKRGDRSLRRALFMAAFAATRLDCWKERYQAMKERGMPPTKAQVALARKIATILFHIHQNDLEFDPDKVQIKTKKKGDKP
jgi:transposase